MKDYRRLYEKALEVIEYSYSPYSNFHVAAVLETVEGKLYPGVNVENASIGATNCAERTALFSAITAGEREFKRMLIIGGLDGNIKDYTPPCGICRQVLLEFCTEDFELVLTGNGQDFKTYRLRELLPHSFGASSMEADGQ